jgi:uncharacterized alkaline shock family protein YloU
MANEMNEMKINDEYGSITYNLSVFSAIARNAVEESDQAEVAESSKRFKADKICRIEDGRLYISLPIRVSYSANVTDVCASLQSKIFESIEYMTDYKPEAIEIQVVGFIF